MHTIEKWHQSPSLNSVRFLLMTDYVNVIFISTIELLSNFFFPFISIFLKVKGVYYKLAVQSITY